MVLSIYFNLPSETLINADTYSFRKARIAAWLAPQKYASTKSYQTLQSLYAIGSGGIFGKGFGNSVQKKPGFIPEAHTDMIFFNYL
ncbi:FtsW/RodA/SpoVE family cell cycle protein [Blautia stercoris]